MKRTIWSGLAAIVLAAAVTIPAIAQPPQGGGGRGPGRGGPAARGAALPLLRALDLTDAQREQIRALTDQRRARGDDPRRAVVDLERQLQLAVFADTPEPQKIDELRKAVAAAHAEGLAARIELQSRIAELLTPEQRAKARDTFGTSRGRGGFRRGGGGPIRGPEAGHGRT